MSTDAELMLIQTISKQTEYLVSRVDDLHDTVDTVIRNMITKDHCEECKVKWVPKSWAKPAVALAVFLAAAAGAAGDLLDIASRFGIHH